MVNEGTVDPTGTPWTDREIDLIVADYFAMLNSELHAQVYVKADNNRNMQQQTGRQRGAIEYKHQNISAVLSQLGFPWISGYKPAWNFQASLITGIERYLENSREDSLLKLLAISDAKEDLIEISGAGFIKDEEVVIPIKQMPDASTKSEANMPELERLVRKFDPSARDAHNRRLGKQGEEKVFYSEQARLWEIGCKDLARRVRWVSEEDGDGAGYDILSFNARRGKISGGEDYNRTCENSILIDLLATALPGQDVPEKNGRTDYREFRAGYISKNARKFCR